MPRWAWCLFIVLLLAGCTAKEPAAEPAPNNDASTLGRISGATVTPDIRPVNGVQVTMNPGGFETESNLIGGFTFANVPPGTYELLAAHPDFAPVAEIVVVLAGETVKPRLVMARDEPPVPQHITDTFPGFIPLGAGPAEAATQDAQQQAGVGNCTCVFDIEPRQDMQTMVIEAVWTDSVQTAQPTQFRWTLDLDDGRSFSDVGASPLLVHMTPETVGSWDNVTTMQVSLMPDDVWPAFEQEYTLFVTIFQVTPAPDGWSLVAGDA